MLPRPESEGEGVPEEVDPHGQAPPLGGGDLQSSLLTLRSAMVEAATREAERVDTAIHILRNKSASAWVYDPKSKGWSLFNTLIVARVFV
jgi:hypothetical protein